MNLFHQRRNIVSTIRLVSAGRGDGVAELPGPEHIDPIAPRSGALVADYLRAVGGSPKAYKGQLPPHMFPQWAWPALTRAMAGLPYDLKSVVNAGCSWTVNGPLPAAELLQTVARIESIEEDDKKVLVHLSAVTGPATQEDALEARLTAFLPKKQEGPKGKRSNERPRVPVDALPIFSREVKPELGRRFAALTGDPNPIHWLAPYARMAGFGGPVLHGFCTAAIAAEALIQNRYAGDVTRLRHFEARFTRPVRMPSRVRVFVRDDDVFVGTQPGGPAFLTGAFHG